MDGEIWKTIDGYPEYQVSNFGRVKGKNCILREYTKPHQRPIVHLRKRTKYVSRVVAKAFVDNPNNLPHVTNINKDYSDNRAKNLKWIAVGETAKEKKKPHKEKRKVEQYTIGNVFIREWENAEDAKSEGFIPSGIGMCCRGVRKSHGGYIWKYSDSDDFDGEQWRTIEYGPTSLTVSNFGRFLTSSGKKTFGAHHPSGYRYLSSRKIGSNACHRVVARAFCDGETKEKCFVNHKDGDKENNRSENLEWVSLSENMHHAYKSGLITKEK